MNKPWTKQWDRVAVIPWPGIEGAYLCLSARKRPQNDGFFAEYCQPHITFTYDAGDIIAEWDGDCGPLQLWWKCDADYEHQAYDTGPPEKAHPHWFYPHAVGAGHWGQCVVTERGLPEAFLRGDYEYIFNTLRWWTEDREDSYPGRLKEAKQ